MDVLIKTFVLGLCFICVYTWRLRAGPTTEAVTETDATTLAEEKTDIPQEEIDDAMILDVGRYTTQAFEYNRDQYMKGENEFYNDTCIDEYMRCILSQTAQMPVCSFNNPWDRHKGYYTRNSYCDVYFDNCRRGYRVWRIIDYGECRFYYDGRNDDVYHTFRRWNKNPLIIQLLKILATPPENSGRIYLNARRNNSNLMKNILQILSTQPGNTEIYVSKFNSSSERSDSKNQKQWRKIESPALKTS